MMQFIVPTMADGVAAKLNYPKSLEYPQLSSPNFLVSCLHYSLDRISQTVQHQLGQLPWWYR
jgi:hypothetical protein